MGDRRARGFTLIEMLVATILLFVGVAAALASLSTSTRSIGIATEHTAAALLAQRKLGEIEAQLAQLNPGENQGDFGADYPGFTWRQNVEPTNITNLYKLDLTIEWQSGAIRRSTQYSTYEIKPPQQNQ